ncbi:hypothetical protein R6Q57_022908 [Mikania cordata]
MSLRINPRPLVSDLLFLKDGHHATHLFNTNDYGDRDPLNVRRVCMDPYDNILEKLSFIHHSGEASWMCECFIILWEVVEPRNPSRGSEEVNPRGFLNNGGAYQLMMVGLVQIYQTTRQFIGDNPETQNQFQRIQDTVSQVMELAHEGHCFALPTHLTT